MDPIAPDAPATAWRGLVFAAALAWLAWLPRPAHAEIGACNVVDALPYTILAPGRYCLDRDIVGTSAEGYRLRIYADEVVFDCADHRIVDSNDANTNAAILVSGDHKDATIRNCVIDNFQTGILVQESADDGSSGHVIENNTILRSRQVGISVSGSNIRIEGNRVLGNTGNLNGVAYGIQLYSSYAHGTGNTIRDNLVADFKPTPPMGTGTAVVGIKFFYVHDTEVTGNTVSGLYSTTNQYTYAIDSTSGTGAVLADNRVLAPPALAAPLDGAAFYGIHLTGTPEDVATHLCRGNTVGHWSTDILGCTQVDITTF
jgi:parallel beta-helix repeat protein